MKKKRKRLLQEPQWSKEIDERSDDKNDKIKLEIDDEKDAMDDEMQDSSESKVK